MDVEIQFVGGEKLLLFLGNPACQKAFAQPLGCSFMDIPTHFAETILVYLDRDFSFVHVLDGSNETSHVLEVLVLLPVLVRNRSGDYSNAIAFLPSGHSQVYRTRII